MTILRRILIAVVALLLTLDVAALGVLKFSGTGSTSDRMSKVVFWIDDKGDAKTAVSILKEEGHEALLKPAKRETTVDSGYRVAMPSDTEGFLKSVEGILKKAGYGPLSYNDDGSVLYYGGIYEKKSEANKIVASLEEKESVVFEVQRGRKKVKKSSQRVILVEISESSVDSVIAAVEDSVEVAETDEEPLEGPDEEPLEESDEEMESK